MTTNARQRATQGFALAEVLVAAALLIAIAVGVSQVIAGAVRAGVSARTRTIGTALAVQRMEQLRSLTWIEITDEVSGASTPLSDLTTDLSMEPASGSGPGLQPSPANTLEDNIPPYVDYLDASGAWVGHGVTPPREAVYIRRWSVRPLEVDPGNALVLQVLVTTARDRSSPRLPEDVRLDSVKTRSAR